MHAFCFPGFFNPSQNKALHQTEIMAYYLELLNNKL